MATVGTVMGANDEITAVEHLGGRRLRLTFADGDVRWVRQRARLATWAVEGGHGRGRRRRLRLSGRC
jgi:hypothetical protein